MSIPIIQQPPAAIILGEGNQPKIYPPAVRAEIDSLCNIVVENCTPAQIPAHAASLSSVRFLFSGWGAPKLDAGNLAFFPKLEAIFYGSGTIKDVATDFFWKKNIPICSAWAANAVPVAEFSFAQIILALKQTHRFTHLMQAARSHAWPRHFSDGGAFGTTVGLVSLGQIGRRVAAMLRQIDVHVLACDPYCPPATAADLGVELVTLPELFTRSRVVSLHTPSLPETKGLITGKLIALLPPGGTLINTARGAVVCEAGMIDALQHRPDLSAILDVTEPEPPAENSPLYDLPNVFLTPHIAGSIGGECGRMGLYMADECRRYLNGQPLQWSITREAAARMA